MFYIGKQVGELYEVYDTSDGSVELCSIKQIKGFISSGIAISGVVKVGQGLKILTGSGDFSTDLAKRMLLGNVLYGTGFKGVATDTGIQLTGIEEGLFRTLYKRGSGFRPLFVPEGVTDVTSQFWGEVNDLRVRLSTTGRLFPLREVHIPSTLVHFTYSSLAYGNPDLFFTSEIDATDDNSIYTDRDIYVSGVKSVSFLPRLFSGVRGVHIIGAPLHDGDLGSMTFQRLYLHNAGEVHLTHLNIDDETSYIVVSGECDSISTDDSVCVARIMGGKNIECRYPIALDSINKLPRAEHFGCEDGAFFIVPDNFKDGIPRSNVEYYSSREELQGKLYEITRANMKRVRSETRKEYERMKNFMS